MAYNKKEEFDDETRKLADFAKALGHPARIAILKTLAKHDTCICGDIVEVLPLAQSTVSQHLNELKKVGLVKGEIEGPRSCYCINKDILLEYSEYFQQFLSHLSQFDNGISCS